MAAVRASEDGSVMQITTSEIGSGSVCRIPLDGSAGMLGGAS
jgi:hypothetical protein